MSHIEHLSDRSGEQLAPSSEHARRTRDRANLSVFILTAFAIGSNTAIALHHWSVLGPGQARALGLLAGIAGGLTALKVAGRLLPGIFRAPRMEPK